MLSGIGPRAELERHGIEVRVDLPGVGRNLQDRYEVGVVNRMTLRRTGSRWPRRTLRRRAIRCTRHGRRASGSLYATNGAGLAVDHALDAAARRSRTCSAWRCSAHFQGYYPGLRRAISPSSLNYLTWAVLKAHTEQPRRRGDAALGRPARPAAVNFHYFEEGSDAGRRGPRRRWSSGIRFVRQHDPTAPASEGLIAEEELPGAARRERRGAARVRPRPTPGATMPPARCAIGAARRGRRADQRLPGARRRRACAWSTPRCSRASPASSSPAPSTWSARRPPTSSSAQSAGPGRRLSISCRRKEYRSMAYDVRAAPEDVPDRARRPVHREPSRADPRRRGRRAPRSSRRAPPTARASRSSSATSPGRARCSTARRACCATGSCRSG